MTAPQVRRFEPRSPANVRAVVVAPGPELTCQIVDHSRAGLRLRLDLVRGVAPEAEVVWRKGQEAGLKQGGESSPGGL